MLKWKETMYCLPYSVLTSSDLKSEEKLILTLVYNMRDLRIAQIFIREKLDLSKAGTERFLRLLSSLDLIGIDEYWQIFKTRKGKELFWIDTSSETTKSTTWWRVANKKVRSEKMYGSKSKSFNY